MIDARPGINAYSTERGQTWYIAVCRDAFSGPEAEQTGVLGMKARTRFIAMSARRRNDESELAVD